MTARPPATERLVDVYLHDLERALAHLEIDERRDVVDPVREHIEEALAERGDTPTATDVEEVLRELGPVEHLARDADNGSPMPHDHARDRQGKNGIRPPAAAAYLLAALIIGMAITASLTIMRVPAFFRPEGGDPLVVAQLTWTFTVFTVAAFSIKRNLQK